ncbi:hypothetical protein G7054_g1536 [Neopestalotiopsis clavispora]|nr:hypothetical protein G7054_g1536 [Neopestalotiopsis clavispora]
MASFTQTTSLDVINFFPSLPPYADPTTGLLSKLPSWLIPYGELMRINRPGGFYAYYFPYLIGIAYTACLAPTPPQPLTLLGQAAILLPVNARAALSSSARRARAVPTTSAHVFTLLQVGAIFSLLGFFPAPCWLHMAVTVVLFFIYALMKRVTYYPQVFLGFPFAWAIFFCLAALDTETSSAAIGPTVALFLANVCWTIIYDTIYAHQDVADDAQAGVKSMALRFKDSTKLLAAVLAVSMVMLLALCGVLAGFGGFYYIGTVSGAAAALAYYIYDVDLKNPESCGAWFGDQFWTVGSALVVGLGSEYLSRLRNAVIA